MACSPSDNESDDGAVVSSPEPVEPQPEGVERRSSALQCGGLTLYSQAYVPMVGKPFGVSGWS